MSEQFRFLFPAAFTGRAHILPMNEANHNWVPRRLLFAPIQQKNVGFYSGGARTKQTNKQTVWTWSLKHGPLPGKCGAK